MANTSSAQVPPSGGLGSVAVRVEQYVELPDTGANLRQFATFGVVESVKAVSDLYAPVSGEVVEVNEALREAPELLNSDPFGEGWIAKVELADKTELDQLMDADAYAAETA